MGGGTFARNHNGHMTQTPEPRPSGRAGRKHISAPVAWVLGIIVGALLGVALGYTLSSVIAGALIGIVIAVGFGLLFSPPRAERRR